MNEKYSYQEHYPPPDRFLQPKLIPVVLKLKDSYGLWQKFLPHFPKGSRYTLGSKIDQVFLASIEYTFLASYSPLSEKPPILNRAISRTDLIKILLLLAWENKCLDTNKYITISQNLNEAGKMLGGWKRQLEKKTLENNAREK